MEWEEILLKAIRGFISTQSPEEFDPLHGPITALSCRHKHRGFREEAEVRIIAVPSNDELANAQPNDEKRPRKPVQFTMKNGVLVPYIMLFGRQLNGNKAKLPIKKIIVGPHPEKEKLKRQKAVKLMLEQHEIEAEVATSDIPYLGR